MKTQSMRTGLLVAAVGGAVALANTVTLPFSFSANTPARASEVNGNFQAVKAAVDDNQAQITSLAGQLTGVSTRVSTLESNQLNPVCPTGLTKVAGECVESIQRAATSWTTARTTCATVQRRLCDLDVLLSECAAAFTNGTIEWTRGVRFDGTTNVYDLVQRNGSSACVFDSGPASGQMYPYRCCQNP